VQYSARVIVLAPRVYKTALSNFCQNPDYLPNASPLLPTLWYTAITCAGIFARIKDT